VAQGTANEKLWRALDTLRQQGRDVSSLDIARHAKEAGVGLSDALHLIRQHSHYRSTKPSQQDDAVSTFVSELCLQAGCDTVLEYTAVDALVTAPLAEKRLSARLSYVARNKDFAEALCLIAGSETTVTSDAASLSGDERMDAIICSTAFGYRPPGQDGDGFGSEVVRELLPLLAEAGTLCWVTGRGVLFNRNAAKTFSTLATDGLHVSAIIDLAPGALPGTAIEGVLIAFRHKSTGKKLVGELRDTEGAALLATALLAGPSKKTGPGWTWLDAGDDRTFATIEREKFVRKLLPKGRYERKTLREVLLHEKVDRADKPLPQDDKTTAFLFVPEYAGSRVTADLQEQTVKPASVYRFAVDPTLANPRFLALLLNGPYGRMIREVAASGATIQRVRVPDMLALQLPIPLIGTQDRIARVNSDIALLQAEFRDLEATLDHDWTAVTDAVEKVDALKAILDIEKQIADWWRELPYPLATIYRRYQVSIEPKDRLETLLHFFEMSAVYLAAIGASYVKAMRRDWQDVMAKWLHPAGSAGIERADFGFWIGLAGASLKDVSRITSDKDLKAIAVDIAGAGLVESASSLGALGKTTAILDVARRYRNSWKGHGGHMKASDAARLDAELQQQVRDLYEATASTLRRLQLVRPGSAEVLDATMRYKLEKLSGSDPTFVTEIVEVDKPVRSYTLAFWMSDTRTMCRAMPFFRLGVPQEPQESSFYVFNRVEKEGFRWISYQEAREQEFVAPDDELLGIIEHGQSPT
jgi:hypothetical protein